MSNKKWEVFVQEIIKLPEDELRRRSEVLRSKIKNRISMKTKDEILGEHPVMCDNQGKAVYVSFLSAMAAMEEYAKQQAISFAKYMFEHVWQMNSMNPSPYTSDEQFYNKFIENQNK